MNGRPRATSVLRILFILTAVSFIPISVMWTQAKRGRKPWTSFGTSKSTEAQLRPVESGPPSSSSGGQQPTAASPTRHFSNEPSPLTVSSAKLVFKDQHVGTTSDPQTVTVVNRGPSPQIMSPLEIEGDFSQTNNCGPELMTGDSCDIAVTFTPTKAGLVYGNLEISSSDPLLHIYTNPAIVTFSGSGKEKRTKPAGTSVAQNEKPPTLLDLFNKDFANVLSVHDNGMDLRSQDGGTIHIGRRIFLDFHEKNEFIAFYIPASKYEVESCTALADVIAPMIADLPNRIEVTGGDSAGVTKLRELRFSGRVFIYHEWPLSNKEKADIIEAYGAKNLDVQFRGMDYLGNQLIAWHQLHDAKAAH
jgi:hypothetical protein